MGTKGSRLKQMRASLWQTGAWFFLALDVHPPWGKDVPVEIAFAKERDLEAVALNFVIAGDGGLDVLCLHSWNLARPNQMI